MRDRPAPSRSRRKIWPFGLVFALVLLIGFESLNFSGFCYRDLRWYDKRQLLDLYFFGPDAFSLSEAEKIRKLMEEKNGVYPDCCWVGPSYGAYGKWSIIMAATGNQTYGLETHMLDKTIGATEPYYFQETAITSCGQKLPDSQGIGEDGKMYKAHLRLNRKKWNNK